MALAITWIDNGNARSTTAIAVLSDTLVIPATGPAVLYLLMANLHINPATSQVVTLTGETVDTIVTWDNSAGGNEVGFGAFAVRNPTSGAKTLTLTDDGLSKSLAWAGYLVTGVPAGGYVDDTDRTAGTVSDVTMSLSLDPTKSNGLLLALFGFRGYQAGPFSTPGWTEDADVNAGASAIIDISYQAVSRAAPTVGNYTATCTATLAGKRGVVAVSVLAGVNRPGSEVFIL